KIPAEAQLVADYAPSLFRPIRHNRTTVRRWVRRYEEEGSLTERVRAPRRRSINEDQLHKMIVSYQESPFTPTRSFAQEYEVSMQTIRNELHRAGVHHRRPAKKIIFTQEQKAARVRFAREYRDFDFTYASALGQANKVVGIYGI
ncbi:hypothetical protein HW555_012944, partial [Spodoptera exigua]